MAVKEGSAAPDFTLPDQNGKNISLKDFKGKWVVLYFYPKDNTPGCTIEAREFTALLKEFEKLGAVILGVSPDSPKSHCNFMEKQDLKITLLSDPEKTVIKKYGAWGAKKMFGKTAEGVIRSTFLISPRGKAEAVWNKVKAEGHAKEALLAVKRLLSA